MDGIEQFVQYWVKFVNCEIDQKTFEEMKMSHALTVKSNNKDNKADVEIMTQELNQSQCQVAKDDLWDNALSILAIPNKQGNTGGDTQGAVELRNGWDFSKTRAKLKDPIVKSAEKRLAKVVLNAIRVKDHFLNGLITPRLFGDVGMTIASALNTAIYAALSFGEEFDWTNLGDSIAAGVNRFFETFDFSALGRTINTWVHGIYDTITTAIGNIKWSEVWDGVTDFLSEIDLETISLIIGAFALKYAGKFLTGKILKETIEKHGGVTQV